MSTNPEPIEQPLPVPGLLAQAPAALALERKLLTLSQVPGISAEALSHFGEMLKQLDAWTLFRLNPIAVANMHGFDLKVLLDLLLHSSRIGLFDLNWTVVCPGCGSLEYTWPSINALKVGTVHCATCFMDVQFSLDEQVEVSFSLNPGICDLSAWVNPYANFENYYRHYFSASFQRAPEMLSFVQALFRGYYVVDQDERANLTLVAEADSLYRVINLQSHSQFWLRTSSLNTGPPILIETDLGDRGFSEVEREVPAGPLTLRIHNCSRQKRTLTLWKADFEGLHRILAAHPSRRTPFLTAKMLLNCQTFREIHRIDRLDPDLSLSIASQTLLFSDLKGSTEIYELTGDYAAYSLVQRHFDLLTASVRRHSGSVVKTIGDAVMASFSTPVDGLLAAIDMHQQIRELNRVSGRPDVELGLKIGLHTGPVLAVNANERLDFFGQTVNLAARVQGLAEAKEIWLTESVYQAGCAEILATAGLLCQQQTAFLKGISSATSVWRCSQASH
ncbi:MAG: hypothetical protein CVV27_06585 [Candidatus Melainabacteria bacterium HGW-Melainabacteria-1]|nr:MAG: hypothetical protein CVV27_06585 [Candidatus Melainabacteria bacterium HGW-Melainabacteria-1]